MGGRGSSSGRNGKGMSKSEKSILQTKTSNITGGKEGTEKQRSYANSLAERNKNTIKRLISERNKSFDNYKQRIKSSEGKPEKVKSLIQRTAKSSLKNEISEKNKEIKRYTQRLKKAKRQKTLGQVISVLS